MLFFRRLEYGETFVVALFRRITVARLKEKRLVQMRCYLSVISALIVGLFSVIVTHIWGSARATRQRTTPKELTATEVSTSPKDSPTLTNNVELYRVVDKEDFSYRTPNGQLFVLKDYSILLLSTDTTSNQIQNIAKNIATQENNVSALNVYFFWPGTEKAGAYTAAMATYAPNGRWDDFQKNAPKELVMKYGRAKVDSALQPSSDFGFNPASSSRKRSNNNSVTSKSSSYSTMSGDYTGAWVSMTYFVKDRLKAPSSAKFEYAGARNVIRLDNDRYRIKSYVDAQNSFGAPIRMHFEGVVRDTKSSWRLEELYVTE